MNSEEINEYFRLRKKVLTSTNKIRKNSRHKARYLELKRKYDKEHPGIEVSDISSVRSPMKSIMLTVGGRTTYKTITDNRKVVC